MKTKLNFSVTQEQTSTRQKNLFLFQFVWSKNLKPTGSFLRC